MNRGIFFVVNYGGQAGDSNSMLSFLQCMKPGRRMTLDSFTHIGSPSKCFTSCVCIIRKRSKRLKKQIRYFEEVGA